MKKTVFEDICIPSPDVEVMKKEHCLCFSCKHSGICKYRAKFTEYQQTRFPEKLDCYKYELEEIENDTKRSDFRLH